MGLKRACKLLERGIVTGVEFVDSVWQCLQEAPDRRDVHLELLEALADHPSDYVRAGVATALGSIKDPAAFDPLCQALGEEDSRLRQRAALALGELVDAQAVEPLTEALEDEDSDVRESAAEGLGKIGAAAIEPLCKALENGTERMRLVAAEAVGRLRGARAVEPLCRLLAYASTDERWRAADAVLHWATVDALGNIGAPAVEPLCRVLGVADAGLRRRAGWALTKVGTPAVEPLCCVLADTARQDGARQEAALALGKLRDSRAVEPLCRVLEDENGEVRSAAVQALGEIGDTRAAGPLRKALEHPGTRLRDPRLDAQVLAERSWTATPWDYSSYRYLNLSDDGTGKLVCGYGQITYAAIQCRWEVPVAGRLWLTYMESPGETCVLGFTPGEDNRVVELGYRLIEGEVSGIQSLIGVPYTFLWTLELSGPPWPPGLQFPYGVPRVFYGYP